VKQEDRLKWVADRFMLKVKEGSFAEVYASREALHELYYVSTREGCTVDECIRRAAALTLIPNLRFLPTTPEVDLLALSLMKNYGLTSVFDAYHAATALNQVEDRVIASTDHVYDRIPGVKRIEPAELVRES